MSRYLYTIEQLIDGDWIPLYSTYNRDDALYEVKNKRVRWPAVNYRVVECIRGAANGHNDDEVTMVNKHVCANCMESSTNHPETQCVLAAFVSILEDRGNLTTRQLQNILENTDTNVFWDQVGPLLDGIEDAALADDPEPDTKAPGQA